MLKNSICDHSFFFLTLHLIAKQFFFNFYFLLILYFSSVLKSKGASHVLGFSLRKEKREALLVSVIRTVADSEDLCAPNYSNA